MPSEKNTCGNAAGASAKSASFTRNLQFSGVPTTGAPKGCPIRNLRASLNKLTPENFGVVIEKITTDAITMDSSEVAEVLTQCAMCHPKLGDVYARAAVKLATALGEAFASLVVQCAQPSNGYQDAACGTFYAHLVKKDLVPLAEFNRAMEGLVTSAGQHLEGPHTLDVAATILSEAGCWADRTSCACGSSWFADIMRTLAQIAEDRTYPSRVRFLIGDLLLMREREWKQRPRQALAREAPMPLGEVRERVLRDPAYASFVPKQNKHRPGPTCPSKKQHSQADLSSSWRRR